MRLTSVVLLIVLACASPASAYFVIVLNDGGSLRADFVRQQANVIHASLEAGELWIEKTRIRSIREVDPASKVDVAKPVAAGLASPPPAAPPSMASAADITDPRERERRVVREIILGHRDLLLAKLRKESPEELAKRQQELDKLKNERKELEAKRPSWERGFTP